MPPGEIQFGFSGVVWLRILFALAIVILTWRLITLLRVLRLGRSENRLDHLGRRLWTFLREVVGQTRMFREPIIGWAHPMIFWGACLFVTASFVAVVGGMFPKWGIPQLEQVPVLGTIVDVFAALILVGIVAAAVRRYIMAPQGLSRTADASLILVLITGLMVTFLVAEAGARLHETEVAQPVGAATLWLMRAAGMSDGAVAGTAVVARWLHAFIFLSFMTYIPFSKHMHLLWAPFGVFLAELPHKGTLPPAPEEDADGHPLSKLTWRMLLNAYSCAECGRCERSCPAAASGSALSPKDLLHDLRAYLLKTGPSLLGRKAATNGAEKGNGDGNGNGEVKLIGDVIKPAALWGCTTCYACMERCPVRNEHVPLITQMRRQFLEEGELDAGLQDALVSLQRYGNSQGKSPRKRFEWAKDLPEPLRDARKEPVDWLWILGDYAAYHPESMRVSKQVAQVFHAAGLDFGVLFEAERNTGNDVRRAGEEGLFEMLAEQNMKAFGKAQFQRIVTADPHSYHTLKREYPAFGLDQPVLHYTELLDECLSSGAIEVRQALSGKAVFHDPCYLGRINGIYDPPRRIMDALGLERVEMPRSRADSFCCGAGGGRIWMEDEEGVTERPAVLRIREALEMQGVEHFVVACPKDLGMFIDAVKTLGAEDRLKVADLGELVYAAAGIEVEAGVTT